MPGLLQVLVKCQKLLELSRVMYFFAGRRLVDDLLPLSRVRISSAGRPLSHIVVLVFGVI